jgi:hypothetical protein
MKHIYRRLTILLKRISVCVCVCVCVQDRRHWSIVISRVYRTLSRHHVKTLFILFAHARGNIRVPSPGPLVDVLVASRCPLFSGLRIVQRTLVEQYFFENKLVPLRVHNHYGGNAKQNRVTRLRVPCCPCPWFRNPKRICIRVCRNIFSPALLAAVSARAAPLVTYRALERSFGALVFISVPKRTRAHPYLRTAPNVTNFTVYNPAEANRIPGVILRRDNSRRERVHSKLASLPAVVVIIIIVKRNIKITVWRHSRF